MTMICITTIFDKDNDERTIHNNGPPAKSTRSLQPWSVIPWEPILVIITIVVFAQLNCWIEQRREAAQRTKKFASATTVGGPIPLWHLENIINMDRVALTPWDLRALGPQVPVTKWRF